MNKKNLVVLIAALAATSAYAQSSVTVYGLVDTAVRMTTAEANGKSQTAMTEGAFQGPRVGFKGEEDLGGGTAAVFKLESGFLSNTGASDQQGQLFGRQAFVGLKDKSLGELDAGRQYGVAFDVLGNYDPLGVGNFNENSWEAVLYGLRFDNTLKYTNTWGPVTAEVQYSIGGQAGSSSIGNTTGAALTYAQGPLSVSVIDQQSTDANSNKLNVAGAGGSFVTGPTTVYLNYFNAKRDAGFAKATNNLGGALANTSLMGNAGNTLQRTDSVWTVGALFQATPAWSFIAGYMTDSVSNDSSAGNSGKIATAYVVADYAFSKRTDVYFTVDHTTLSGGEVGAEANSVANFGMDSLGNETSRNGVAVGLRVKF